MAKKLHGKNLFAIDLAAVDATLAEANRPLLSRRDGLLKAFDRIPAALATVADIDVAQGFAKEVYGLLAEAKQARLDDGRPFAEATKTAKAFFDRIEGPLKAIIAELTQRVTAAAKRQQSLAALQATNDTKAKAPAGPPPPVAQNQAGKPIVSVQAAAAAERAPALPVLQWTIEGFDRDKLDLEALRPFLTEFAILQACKKHLETHGPNTLRAVTYGQVATAGQR